ncbi:MAG: OmpA family protein [Alphaproteobacteria bacterium]|nr:OmpA family protein [Alphaproteobacteria bacterium]
MKLKMLLTGVAMVALSACAGQQLGMAEKATPQGSEFQNALSTGYLRLARDEYSEADYADADYFARRSVAAGGGDAVSLPEATDRNLPQQDALVVASFREELTDVFDRGAREKAPVLAASAQVAYECWIQEWEENRQPAHVEACRSQLDGLIPALRNAVAETPAPVVVQETPLAAQSYRVYFDTNSTELQEQGVTDVILAAQDFKDMGRARIVVAGHTDSVGNPAANQALSKRRADAVAAALRARGVPAGAISTSFAGEGSLAIRTADGVDEINNRRVDITVSPVR